MKVTATIIGRGFGVLHDGCYNCFANFGLPLGSHSMIDTGTRFYRSQILPLGSHSMIDTGRRYYP